MVKGFGEASVSRKKRSKSSPLKPAIDGEQLQQQLEFEQGVTTRLLQRKKPTTGGKTKKSKKN